MRGAYTTNLYHKSNPLGIDGYFTCRICGIQHFIDEALIEGEMVLYEEEGGQMVQEWLCPVCGFDEAKAKQLQAEIGR